MHSNILKRCGVVLIVVGVVDIAFMIWCVSNGRSYSSSFNIFAVIGGILLVRGNLKVARWGAMLSSFMLAACVGAIVGMPLMFPLGYWLAVFRSGGGGALSILVVAGMLALSFWLRRELHRPEVLRAQADAGVAPPRVAPPIVVGGLLSVLLVGLLFFTLRGETAKQAIQRAEQQVGGSYRFVVTHIQMRSAADRKSVFAIVAAYNDSELKTVQVSWEE